jgi:hypothetical protein
MRPEQRKPLRRGPSPPVPRNSSLARLVHTDNTDGVLECWSIGISITPLLHHSITRSLATPSRKSNLRGRTPDVVLYTFVLKMASLVPSSDSWTNETTVNSTICAVHRCKQLVYNVLRS